jgi:hypothetical protein
MTQNARPSHTEHPVALGSFRSWMRLLGQCSGVDRAYVPRAAFVALTTFVTAPLRLVEVIRHGRAIRRTAIQPSPVFIVGHWRSGTTHLHNLLCQDEQFGYLTTFQAMTPGFCLLGDRRIKPALARLAGKRYPTRLIDNIPLTFDAPQEDEFAIASLSPRSFLHGFSFPQQAHEFFERYVLFHGLSETVRTRWIKTYLGLMRKSTYLAGGRRLMIKNCAHSGRIRTLLSLFPDAKFIHIHRNPYEVFVSTVHMHRTVLPRSQLQDVTPDQVEANVLKFYERLMHTFLSDKAAIPAENVVEIRFEDLERAPLEQLRRIYERLRLPEFEKAAPAFDRYLETVTGYRKNAYRMDDDVIEKVNHHWAFAFDEWGYDRLDRTPIGLDGKPSPEGRSVPEGEVCQDKGR